MSTYSVYARSTGLWLGDFEAASAQDAFGLWADEVAEIYPFFPPTIPSDFLVELKEKETE